MRELGSAQLPYFAPTSASSPFKEPLSSANVSRPTSAFHRGNTDCTGSALSPPTHRPLTAHSPPTHRPLTARLAHNHCALIGRLPMSSRSLAVGPLAPHERP